MAVGCGSKCRLSVCFLHPVHPYLRDHCGSGGVNGSLSFFRFLILFPSSAEDLHDHSSKFIVKLHVHFHPAHKSKTLLFGFQGSTISFPSFSYLINLSLWVVDLSWESRPSIYTLVVHCDPIQYGHNRCTTVTEF